MPHLVVSISGHGFGHVAQTAPVLNVLCKRVPQLRLTIRSAVPIAHLRTRIQVPFIHLHSEGDSGMVMSSALEVNVPSSQAVYGKFHTRWDSHIADERQLLRELKADWVFSNVGYLSLAGAQLENIPNAALCSLNWYDIYRHYCGNDPIALQILECYTNADIFFRATPGMDMDYLPNRTLVDPIADVGVNRRDTIDAALRLSSDEKLVLVSMGGIASRLPIERWPCMDGVRWVVQRDWQVRHPSAIILESLGMHFGDVLASCDALICKPGYGSFVEAAGSGVPVLYVNRPDWPEAPALVEWLQRNGICREMRVDELASGKTESLLAMLHGTKPEPVLVSGANQIADWLEGRL